MPGSTLTVWVKLTNATISESGLADENATALWGTKGWTTTPATGATAGKPGSFTPSGAMPPVNVAGLTPAIVASPATAWTSGQYVQTQVPGVAGRAHWSGSAWVAGATP